MPTDIQRQPLFLRCYEEYRERRYLIDATDHEIVERAKQLIQNLTTLTDEGKIGMIQVDERDGFFLLRLFSHVLEECRLRTGDPRGLFVRCGMRDTAAPKPTAPAKPASADVLKCATESLGCNWLFKFGNLRWMQALLTHGSLRVAPASLYNDTSLAQAIYDDELSYDLASSVFKTDIKGLDPFKIRLSESFGAVNKTRTTTRSLTNYYVWCATHHLDVRLFDDFGADAVLAVKNPEIFTRRFIAAISKQLPGWSVDFCQVNYFDPYHPTHDTESVYRSKHFKYMYQQELRYVFLPPSPIQSLTPLQLELGPLDDIAFVLTR